MLIREWPRIFSLFAAIRVYSRIVYSSWGRCSAPDIQQYCNGACKHGAGAYLAGARYDRRWLARGTRRPNR